eukprot:gene11055-3763_t
MSSPSKASQQTFEWNNGITSFGKNTNQSSAMSTSTHFLARGTKSGTVYIYDRSNFAQKLLISSTEFDKEYPYPIVHISISFNEQYIGVTTGNNSVYIFELLTNNLTLFAKQVSKHQQHQHNITSVTWTLDSQKFITGDIEGFSLELIAKPGFLQQATNKYVKEKCEIVQLYASKDAMVMSSLQRSILISTVQNKLQLQVVGTKPRDGKYGACFHFTPTRGEKLTEGQKYTVTEYLFSARPGRRLWCCDKKTGKVLSTLSFPKIENVKLNFQNIFPFGPYILSWSEDLIAVLDVQKLLVLDYNSSLKPIISVSIFRNVCYVLHGEEVTLSKLYWDDTEFKKELAFRNGGNTQEIEQKKEMVAVATKIEEKKEIEKTEESKPTSQITVIEKTETLVEIKPVTLQEEKIVKTEVENEETKENVKLDSEIKTIEEPKELHEEIIARPMLEEKIEPQKEIEIQKLIEPEIETKLEEKKEENKVEVIKVKETEITPEIETKHENEVIEVTKKRKKKKKAIVREITIMDKKSDSNNSTPFENSNLDLSQAIQALASNESKETKIDIERSTSLDAIDNSEEVERIKSIDLISHDESVNKNNSLADSEIISLTKSKKKSKSSSDLVGEKKKKKKVVKKKAIIVETPSSLQLSKNESSISISPSIEVQSDSSSNPTTPASELVSKSSLKENLIKSPREMTQNILENIQSNLDTIMKKNDSKTNQPLSTKVETKEEIKKEEDIEVIKPKPQEIKKTEEEFQEEEFEKLMNDEKYKEFKELLKKLSILNEQINEYEKTKDLIFCPDLIKNLKDYIESLKELINLEKVPIILNKENEKLNQNITNFWFKWNLNEKSIKEDEICNSIEKLKLFLNFEFLFILFNKYELNDAIEKIFEIQKRHFETKIIIDKINFFFLDGNYKEGINEINEFILQKPSLALRFFKEIMNFDFKTSIHFAIYNYPNIKYWNLKKYLKENSNEMNFYMKTLFETRVEVLNDYQFLLKFIEILMIELQEIEEKENQISFIFYLISLISNDKESLKKLKEIFLKFNFYDGILKIFTTEEMIDYLIQKDDLNLLSNFMNDKSSNFWNKLFKKINEQKEDEKKITKQSLIILMCNHLNSKEILSTLESSSEYCKNLNPIIFKKICELAKIEKEQQSLKYEMSQIIDTYLWSEKENKIAPQIRGILNSENENMLNQFELNETTLKSVDILQFIEDSGIHWGLTIHSDDQCQVCKLPIANNKILSFKCGHSFHSKCVPYEACPTCYQSNFGDSFLD